MQIVRTAVWIGVTAILAAFVAMNWTKVPVNFWPLDNGSYIHFEWPVGIVALLFFTLGVVPVWLYLRAMRWRLTRRIANLENAMRASSMPSINARPDDVPSIGTASLETPSPTISPDKLTP